MSTLNCCFTLLRLFAMCIGYFVILMALAGHLGLADFRLSFTVPEARP